MALKKAIGVGIGLFVAFIGFYDAGFVIRPRSAATPVTLVTIDGLCASPCSSSACWSAPRWSRCACGRPLLLGILASTVLAIIFNEARGLKLWPGGEIAAWPHPLVGAPDFSLLWGFSLPTAPAAARRALTHPGAFRRSLAAPVVALAPRASRPSGSAAQDQVARDQRVTRLGPVARVGTAGGDRAERPPALGKVEGAGGD
ncbi:MAG TPA: hypothetical protein VFA45_00100, partial [Actinomycetes bacterium]|nr:hypothetical protein [Actinomycetes bacterium]